jgi:hypothetical protein
VAAPNPLSVVIPQDRDVPAAFTTIMTSTIFMLKALAFPHGTSWNLMVNDPG